MITKDNIQIVWVHDPIQNQLRCDARVHLKLSAFATNDTSNEVRKKVEDKLKDEIMKCLFE